MFSTNVHYMLLYFISKLSIYGWWRRWSEWLWARPITQQWHGQWHCYYGTANWTSLARSVARAMARHTKMVRWRFSVIVNNKCETKCTSTKMFSCIEKKQWSVDVRFYLLHARLELWYRHYLSVYLTSCKNSTKDLIYERIRLQWQWCFFLSILHSLTSSLHLLPALLLPFTSNQLFMFPTLLPPLHITSTLLSSLRITPTPLSPLHTTFILICLIYISSTVLSPLHTTSTL